MSGRSSMAVTPSIQTNGGFACKRCRITWASPVNERAFGHRRIARCTARSGRHLRQHTTKSGCGT
eukprot:1238892-Prymnesium_polylepis.1